MEPQTTMLKARHLTAAALSAFVAIAGALLIPVFTAAPAAADTEGDWEYTVNTSPVVSYITGYTGPGGAVTTPATLGGHPVATVEGDTFVGRTDVTSVTVTGPNVVSVTGFANSGVTDVVLPEGVTNIGFEAFRNTPLSSVSIPSTAQTIGVRAFMDTPNLTSITLPDGLASILPSAFSFSGLASVVIPDSVTLIQSGAFLDTPLTDVTIGSGITNIENDVFSNTSLTSVTVPNNVVSIGGRAFSGSPLASVTLPSNLKSIGQSSFSGTLLTSVDFPAGLLTVGDSAFSGSKLTSATLPSSVAFGNDVFSNNQITNVTIEDGREDVPSGMFYGNLLEMVAFPESVTTIGDGAFAYNLFAGLVIPSSVTTIGSGAFSDNLLTGLVIPSSVTTIGSGAFAYNLLTDLAIPSSVTIIGDGAFSDNLLTEVTIPATVANVGAGAFDYNHLNWIDVDGASTTINVAYDFQYGARTWLGFFLDGQWAAPLADNPGVGRYWSGWDPAIVTLDGNGGTADTPELQVPWDTATVVAPTAARAGYALTGWSATADGSAGLFDWNDAMHLDVAYYAQWAPVIVTTTLDANGGVLNSPASIDAPVGGAFAPVATPPTRDGYTFLGWTATVDGLGGLVSVDQTATADVTLFAQWKVADTTAEPGGSVGPVVNAGSGASPKGVSDLAHTGFQGFATLIAGFVLAMSGASLLLARSWAPRNRRNALGPRH